MPDPAIEPDFPDGHPRVQVKNYGSLRATLLSWGVPLALAALFVVINLGSGVATSVASVPVTCEGYTRIDPEGCAPWAREVLEGELPQSHGSGDVRELIIKRSVFGLVHHCIAQFALQDGGTIEGDIQCR